MGGIGKGNGREVERWGLPLSIGESGFGSGGGEEWRKVRRGAVGLGRPGTCF